jgi:hypothetical protein
LRPVFGLNDGIEIMIRKAIELVREGDYAVEVPIDLIIEDGGWSPYFSLEDARKLEVVRLALRKQDLVAAARHGHLFELVPVAP